ncbi:hypothetical protein K2173_018586 [Erythroxylum novogranatense]|uniref:Reverse transcriptase zinc-binding domain-containing protein n=1 Tax=Erythroxylum novogranatense TaxID=1862640 RepID=A0AAV8UE99_9ROSI|nr:hypothetical protein K2173_018586 [Erythroxylum novogranatense]
MTRPNWWKWRWEGQGDYSVKSAYKMLQDCASVTDEGECLLWRLLWKLQVPPKVKHFLWCALSNILTTKLNLYRKKIVDDALCPLCQEAPESVDHAFLWCTKVWYCWDRLALVRPIGNTVIWGHRLSSAPAVLWAVHTACREWEEANSIMSGSVHHGARAGHPTRWSPPMVGQYKCNFDAALDVSTQRISYGSLIRDHQGNIIHMFAKIFYGPPDPTLVEAIGMKKVNFGRCASLKPIEDKSKRL